MYKIVSGGVPKDLEAKVNTLLKCGWREAGGVSTDCDNFLCQAMVRVKRKYLVIVAGSPQNIAKKLNRKKHWRAVGGMAVESYDGGYMYSQLLVKET